MKKQYYVLECRKMKKTGKLIPNETTHIVGIYNNPEKAEVWITKNGVAYFLTDKQVKEGTSINPKRFFALLTGSINSNDLILHKFYDINGSEIKIGE